jgi:hypothetical protein
VKVTVSPDGQVAFDTDDVAQAVAMVKALRNGAAPEPPRSHRKKVRLSEEGESLGDRLGSAWQYLVDHDVVEGLGANDLSAGMGITATDAAARFKDLVKKGLAHKVRRGRYRPGPPPQAPAEASQEPLEPPE